MGRQEQLMAMLTKRLYQTRKDNHHNHRGRILTPEECAQYTDQLYTLLLASDVKRDILAVLPYEIGSYIFHFVDMANLTKAGLVSKAWHQHTLDNEVWKSTFLHHRQWRITLSRLDPNVSPNWKKLCKDRLELDRRWRTRPEKSVLFGHEDSVYCIQFDNEKIVTGSRDTTIKFWDANTFQCIHTLHGHSRSVLCLQYNDKIMVSGSSDNNILVWDMVELKPIARLRDHTSGVLDVCFDEHYIVSCSKDSTIKVWDVETKVLLRTMTGHRGPVNAVQLYKGQVASASGDGLVKLWNVETGRCIRDFIGHERGLACVQFDGKLIISGSNDKTIRVWDAATGQCIKILTGHEHLVRTLHFDKQMIVSGSYDHTVKVWDLETGQCTLNLDEGHSSWVFDVQFSASRIVR
ncbi:hypothetical protein BGZ81_010262 [Podila clonocystis]|nr:hypothetical protein BGZ81_010262 [Podila clonocystis]